MEKPNLSERSGLADLATRWSLFVCVSYTLGRNTLVQCELDRCVAESCLKFGKMLSALLCYVVRKALCPTEDPGVFPKSTSVTV